MVQDALPVGPTKEMKVVLLEKAVSGTPCSVLDQPLVDEEVDDVAGSDRWPAGECGVGDECLLIVGCEGEGAPGRWLWRRLRLRRAGARAARVRVAMPVRRVPAR